MTTISVEQLPESIVKRYGHTINYKTLETEILRRKLRKIKNFFYNKEDDSYGPFEGKQAIDFLKILDYENSL